MSSYPSYASFFSRSYSNVSHQNFLVQPASSGELTEHRQMQFRLPTNANLHMEKTRLVFALNTSNTGSGGTAAIGRLASAKSIIDRITVDFGGVSVSSGVAQHAVLQQCLDNMRVIEEDPVLSGTQLVRRMNPATGASLANTASETYNTAGNTQYFSIELGPFFKTLQPNLFPLSVVSSVDISIFLSGNATVVSTCNSASDDFTSASGGTQCPYTVDNYRLMVSAYSIDDGIFDQVISTRLNSQDGLDAMFCDYQGFSDTFNGSTRVSSASSSLDKIIVAFRTSGFNGVKPAKGLRGYNITYSDAVDKTTVLDQPAVHGGGGYLNHNLNFTAPVSAINLGSLHTLPSISTSINSIRFPSYDMKLGVQSYELLKEAFEVDNTQSQSLTEYLTNRCQVATKLNLPGSQQLRAKSGLNLQGSNSTILVEAVGDTSTLVTTGNVMVFLESTCMLKLGSGKQLTVIR